MATTTEQKKEGNWGGRRGGPPSEEERQQHEAQFKQAVLDEYRKRYGDSLISAEQTWELYRAVKENWHAKMKERHGHGQRRSPPPNDQGGSPNQHSPPPHRRHSPGQFEEKRKQFLAEAQEDLQKNFATAHGTEKINAEQAWALIQKVQQKKREKWQADRQKHGHGHGHGHGPGDHGRRSPPHNQ